MLRESDEHGHFPRIFPGTIKNMYGAEAKALVEGGGGS